MTEYFEMAFRGRDDAIDFEKATVELFRESFGFRTKHVGPVGLTPDVLLISDPNGYQAIIDNKAYSKYSISNDHHNRMVYNYLSGLDRYSTSSLPIAFFPTLQVDSVEIFLRNLIGSQQKLASMEVQSAYQILFLW